jgi:uncharacterized membrane protein
MDHIKHHSGFYFIQFNFKKSKTIVKFLFNLRSTNGRPCECRYAGFGGGGGGCGGGGYPP